MKKCPTCDKTFDDGMRFCQTDGTPLVEVADAANADPFKTMVGGSQEMTSAIPPDPFKTMVAPLPKKEEKEVLETPEEPDFLKTMVSSPRAGKMSEPAKTEEEIENVPPSPFSKDVSTDVPKPESSDDKFSFGGQSSAANDIVPQADSGYSPIDENPSSPPIPSPFEESMIGYQAPAKPPPFDEPEPLPVGGNDPFQPPSPFEVAEVKAEALNTPYAEQVENQFNQPIEQANWTPPPAPDANWQNQQIGQNTPFQPPPAGQAQNQTLAIISLVSGILSLACCWFIIPGIAAVVTGFMAKNKAEQNPNEFGGRGLALGGIITGAISLLLGIVLVIIYVVIPAFLGL